MIFFVVGGIFFTLAWFGVVFVLPKKNVGENGIFARIYLKMLKPLNSCLAVFFVRDRTTSIRRERINLAGYGIRAWKAGAPLGKFMAVALLVAAPVLIGTLHMSGTYRLLMPAKINFEHESKVSQVMNESALVPPPALPPSIFAVSKDQQFEFADRDWQKLDAGFMQQILQLIVGMKSYGYELVLLEGYRSPERQDMLATRGTNVTRAGANQSKHQFGLAVDMAFLRDGKLVIAETEPWAMEGYQHMGKLAKQSGLIWGGGWSFQDFGHVESAKSLKNI